MTTRITITTTVKITTPPLSITEAKVATTPSQLSTTVTAADSN